MWIVNFEAVDMVGDEDREFDTLLDAARFAEMICADGGWATVYSPDGVEVMR